MKQQSNFFHAHLHTQYSSLDGMSKVALMVQRAHDLGQPGIATTDHGNGAAWVALYKEAMRLGMKPFPGVEGYLIDPNFDGLIEESSKANRYHLGLLALTPKGYKGLVKFVSMTHTRPRFSRFPRFTLDDLASFGMEYGDHVALTTGCYFGWVQQSMINDGPKAAEKIIKMFSQWFPHTYVEVQHHNIDHSATLSETGVSEYTDDLIVQELVTIADKLSLPAIATQDAHYTYQREKKAHALMKRMVYGGVEDEFPGDSFHLASGEWVAEHYTKKQWARFEDGYTDLLDRNRVKIKPLDKFVIDVPGDWKNPFKLLSKRVWKAHAKLMKTTGISGSKKERKYVEELDEQLSVIEDLGMAAYFLIWDDFVQWCRKEQIAIEARGSANGSYVCYLLGITQIDPIADGCMSERFLSRDRIKPPDIDLDIEDARKPEAVAYFARKMESVQIGTWGSLGITVNPETGEERGSVFATWQQGKRRQCEAEAIEAEQARCEEEDEKFVKYKAVEIGKKEYAKHFGWMKSIDDVRRYSESDYVALKEIQHMNSCYKSYGVHAGGVLLSGNKVKISDYIPTMLVASSDTTCTMFDMDAVEEFGLLKNDLLGQTSLSVMRRCQVLMGREDPTDFSWIPRDDPAALKLLRDGRTETGIFHFEGYTKAKGGRELGVKSVKDAILVQALYMPGCMDVAPGQSISQKDLYIKRRKSMEARQKITYIHPVFEKHLSSTFGCVVFQEQVISIMRDLGMSIASVNKFFKVVKDSGKGAVERNKGRMAEVRDEFDTLCINAGIDPDEAWDQTASFVAYGFNRNHATGYGVRSYRTAYMKAHFPLQYMTALLQSWAGRDKEKVYAREVRRMEIPILPPDINNPSFTWSMDQRRGAIRRGLVSIAGIGEKVAAEIAKNAPYSDMDDFANRVNARIITGCKMYREGETWDGLNTGVLKKLNDSGVLDGLLKK